ncbi:hypothetical protein BC829DRAFT_177423 [Chytridium lagenaria]|nr:hypothetical protein BC829DRAFT_177423 [Chytridium lagenaria]
MIMERSDGVFLVRHPSKKNEDLESLFAMYKIYEQCDVASGSDNVPAATDSFVVRIKGKLGAQKLTWFQVDDTYEVLEPPSDFDLPLSQYLATFMKLDSPGRTFIEALKWDAFPTEPLLVLRQYSDKHYVASETARLIVGTFKPDELRNLGFRVFVQANGDNGDPTVSPGQTLLYSKYSDECEDFECSYADPDRYVECEQTKETVFETLVAMKVPLVTMAAVYKQIRPGMKLRNEDVVMILGNGRGGGWKVWSGSKTKTLMKLLSDVLSIGYLSTVEIQRNIFLRGRAYFLIGSSFRILQLLGGCTRKRISRPASVSGAWSEPLRRPS